MISDFDDELRAIGGPRNEAATRCLSRYFWILKSAKAELRQRLGKEDIEELADLASTISFTGDIVRYHTLLIEHGSPDLQRKLRLFSNSEKAALCDAVDRTIAARKALRKQGAETQFFL